MILAARIALPSNRVDALRRVSSFSFAQLRLTLVTVVVGFFLPPLAVPGPMARDQCHSKHEQKTSI